MKRERVRGAEFWGAHSSRVLVAASRRNELMTVDDVPKNYDFRDHATPEKSAPAGRRRQHSARPPWNLPRPLRLLGRVLSPAFTASALLFLLAVTAPEAFAQDAIHRTNGSRQSARVVGLDDRFLKAEVLLVPGQPPATISIPRSEVVRVEFAETDEDQRVLKAGRAADATQVTRLWRAKEPFLRFANSNAGAFALLQAQLLLKTPERAPEALALFERVEKEDWSEARRAEAGRGKLTAMIATGRAAEAVEQAKQLAINAEDPATLIEAKFVLGQATAKTLRDLLAENPRWDEDEKVRPERHRLYHEALDLLLFPYLFFGAETEPAARGLWAALELYRFLEEPARALELAKDLTILYPQSSEAQLAVKLLPQDPKTPPAKSPPPP